MMTSSSFNSYVISPPRGSHRPLGGILLVSLLFLLPATACSGGGGNGPDPCEDELPPSSIAFPDTTTAQAKMLLEARSQYTSDGKRTDSTLLNLGLVDLSAIKIDSRFPAPCCASMACFQLSGSPSTSCRGTPGGACGKTTCSDHETCIGDICVTCETPQAIEANKAILSGSGLASGPIELENKGGGKFLKSGLAAPLFATGAIELQITGRAAAGYFPSANVTVNAPDALVLTEPDPTKPSNAASGTDMPIRWKAGNGDRVEISLRSVDPSATDMVVCIARDDGCATLPIGAIEWIKLTMRPTEKLSLTVKRILNSYVQTNNTTGALIKASQRVDLILDP